jgi:hypothetical protein
MATELTRSMGGGVSFNGGVGTQGSIPRVPSQNSGVDAGLEDSRLRTLEVSLTSAQLLALRATPITIVPAITGKVINFVHASLQAIYGTIAYTESGCNLGFKYTNGSGVQVNETVEVTGFIDQVVNMMTHARPKLDPIVTTAGSLSQALVLHNLGGGELAAGDGVLKVKIIYTVHNLS